MVMSHHVSSARTSALYSKPSIQYHTQLFFFFNKKLILFLYFKTEFLCTITALAALKLSL